MSDKVIKAIVCPGCGELSKAEIHTSINPARDKTIRKRVLDGELFDFRCPSCGYTAKLNYPLLYNDMKNRFMVYLKLTVFSFATMSLKTNTAICATSTSELCQHSMHSRKSCLFLNRDLTIWL